MRYTQSYLPTRKEDPADAEVISHKLLLRGGFIRQVGAGIYSFLPLGWRVVRKVEQIVRQEMDRAGAQEVMLPAVQPASLWEESGRWTKYGPELLRFNDRKGNPYCLGPTHEEVIIGLVRDELRSYKQLPVILYQIQVKFRDEVRPRAGLMRAREFTMKDAYSFDRDEAGAIESYRRMFDTYNRIFARCGFTFRPVEADTGSIGGSMSHEFQVLADTGEDAIVSCPACSYTANVELAQLAGVPPRPTSGTAERTRVETPRMRTVEQVTGFLGVGADRLVKTLIYMVDEQPVAILVRGDTEANEIKIKRALDAVEVRMAEEEEVIKVTSAPVGFAGPVGLTIPIHADSLVAAMTDFVVGANEEDAHLTGCNWGRDFQVDSFVDVRMARPGDPCGRCGAAFEGYKGIEVGHVFYLGTRYSGPMKATFLDADGEARPFVMGCYGIGITRIVSAAIEQNHDERGIIWPMALAPYQVLVLPVQYQDEAVLAAAGQLHDELEAVGIEVLLDDRDERPGFKFNDADLIGIPLRVTVSTRGLKADQVEIKLRGSDQAEMVPLRQAVSEIGERVRRMMPDR
ncbi:MAG: proline--tRNA ligase [Bradymonadales bacterium]|nr:proline--tRNA ligase [Bradymonadales bacterium]